MRTLMVVVALAVGIWLFATFPAATKEKAGQKAAGSLAERIQDLNLTEEQEFKIADIRKEYRSKVQAVGKELAAIVKEEVGKVLAVLTPEQKVKLEAAKEKRKEHREDCLAHRIANLMDIDLTDAEMTKIGDIREEYRPKIEKAVKELQGLLSDDQKKAREEALKEGKKRREVLQSLKLNDEQKEKVQGVGKELAMLVRGEMEEIRDVLSEAQKEKLQDLKKERKEHVRDRVAHRIANHKDLSVTDEQKAQIADIRKEYRPRVHEAGNNLRATVREEVDAIVAVIKK